MTFTSDEQRREVAERLRILASHAPADKDYVLDALGLYPGEYIDGFDPYCVNELADLIDRPTCRNENSFDRSFFCSACGYEAWTRNDSDCYPKDFSFCPNCGAEVFDV